MAKARAFRCRYLCFALLCLAVVLFLFLLADSHVLRSAFNLRFVLDDAQQLRQRLLDKGLLAPFLFLGLQILQILVAPMPGEATGILGGYVFGLWPSFLLSTVGLALGSWIAFAIGRFFGDLIGDRMRRTAAYAQFDAAVHKGDYVIPFLFFLIPGFPKDMLSYILGMSRMPMPVFMFISAVGRMPGTLLLSLQGASVYERNFKQFVLVTLLGVIIFGLSYLFRKRFLQRFDRGEGNNGRRSE